MYKADYSIKLLTIAGVHRPIEWSLIITKTLYNIFTAFMISHFYLFDISLCMYLVLYTLNDIDEFAESLCWSLAAFVTCIKMTNFLLRGNDIIRLMNILNEDCLKIRDSTEKMMQEKCDFIAR
ncbi:uncharacterized protein LOC122512686 [Leptopilina heterotoma]|uniref:uncharacterized protein LOC122512686 n=1 Tax=Leptopilina heterotoma TaxID=63436 RepID=UPI001CA9D0DE|nr:uncharacterized protein LOC122512686 [Leptopilina heterotoma]